MELLLVLVLIGVFWVLPIVKCRSIFREKGYSGAAGVTLGFFLGLLGLLIAALLPYKQHVDPPGSLRPCPECAEPIRREAIRCRFCGAVLSRV